VALAGNWCGQGATEGVDHGRESAVGLVWSHELLSHEGFRVGGEQTELLLGGHRVIAGAEQLRCDFSIVVRFIESARWGVRDICGVVGNLTARFEKHG